MCYSQSNHRIGFTDIAAKLPKFMYKVPYLLTHGLKQGYLRISGTPASLGIAFEKSVRRNPDGYVLKFKEQLLSYDALNQSANQIAHFYLSLGIKKGDVIAIMMENRPEFIATVIALAKIGVTIALVNLSQTGKILSQTINLVQPIAIIVGEECQNAIIAIRTQLNIAADRFYWLINKSSLQEPEPGTAPRGFENLGLLSTTFATFNPATTHKIRGQDGLFYLYTLETTGRPKAVIFSHHHWMLAYGTCQHILDLDQQNGQKNLLSFKEGIESCQDL